MSTGNPDVSGTVSNLTKSHSSSSIPIDSSQASESSPDAKKSQGDSLNKNRRKRKPKKVSTSIGSLSDTEPMDIDHEITDQVSIPVVNTEDAKIESDCETIEKIAKMVSNITQPTVEEKSVLDTSEEVINEVENRLEEMFADVPQPTVNEEKPNEEPKPKEEAPKEKSKPKRVRKKKPDVNSKKQLKKNINGSKSKDKKGDKPSKGGKYSGDKNSKVDSKKDGKKSQKSKENGSKSKVKNDVAPYLQILKDGSFSIVNQTVNGDEDADKVSNKQKKPITNERHRQHIRGLHVSTLSNKYDADKRDASWICVFCKLGPHKFKLGDLFGPYILSKHSNEYSLCLEDPANDIFRQSNKDKFLPIKSPTNAAKKKRKNSDTKKSAAPAVNGPEVNDEVFNGMTAVDENSYEIWFHEDCIAWSQGTYIIGTKIIGMEAAVWQSTRHRCEYCQKNGAMIACLSRGCAKEAHVICASKSWKLCEDFKTYCDQHI